jgi:hypothetical protein
VFEGGFLGLDNIGLFNRSEPLPTGGVLEQAVIASLMSRKCSKNLDAMSSYMRRCLASSRAMLSMPTGGVLEQADSTGWMAFYSLTMLNIALELAKHRPQTHSCHRSPCGLPTR